jgi:hypothetical protein
MFPHLAIFTFLSYIESDVLLTPDADIKSDANGYAFYRESGHIGRSGTDA